MHIILLQNWAVALNANVWTSSQYDSLVSRTNIPQFLIWIYRTHSCAFIKYSLRIPPRRFLPSFFFSQWHLRLYSVQKTHGKYCKSAARNVEGDVILDVEVSPITSQQQIENTDDDRATVQLWSCVQQTGLNGGCSAHENNYCYSVFLHWTARVVYRC